VKTKIGYRGERSGGEKGHGVTGTEGNGTYVADNERLAEFFGDVVRIEFIPPKNPLVVNEEPLYLLLEADELFEPIDPKDSVWTKANKEATKRSGVTDEHWNPSKVAEELTAVLKEWGYDGVEVTSGGESWTVLFDPSAVVKKEAIRSEDKMDESKKINEGIKATTNSSGDLVISVEGQEVLKISEVSDDEVINLFLYPIGGAGIQNAENLSDESSGNEPTHELMAKRNKAKEPGVDERGTQIMTDIFRAQ
jgi:hypothetical protein